MNGLRAAVALLGILASAGCSFEHERARLAESVDEEIPDIEFSRVEHVVMEGDVVILRLSAGDVRSYTMRRKHMLSDVVFEEFDRSGRPISSGRLERVQYDIGKERAEFQGQVELYSHREMGRLQGADLVWNERERILTGPPDGLVVFEKDDGTRMEGYGLRIDLATNEISLDGGVRGSVVVADGD